MARKVCEIAQNEHLDTKKLLSHKRNFPVREKFLFILKERLITNPDSEVTDSDYVVIHL